MRKFIFPITTGRSGTVFLTELLRRNCPEMETHHERTGYTTMGVDTPDASHFMLFNSVGNVERVQDFWAQKTKRILRGEKPDYAEISHYLFKAGLVENLAPLLEEGEVHLILLTRNVAKVHWSYVNRHEFTNSGYTWLFALDPQYPNTLVSSKELSKYGAVGNALWYIHEVHARMEYYALLMADQPGVHIHRIKLPSLTTKPGAAKLFNLLGQDISQDDIVLPEKQNATSKYLYGKEMEAQCNDLVKRAPMNSLKTAKAYFEAGRRLGFAGYKTMPDVSQVLDS